MNESSLELHGKNATSLNESQLYDLYLSWKLFDSNLGDEGIVLSALYIPVFIFGFFGNIIVTLLVLTNQQLRNATNFYLCNMAIADFLVTLICVPTAVGQALYRVWIYGEFMCKITAYLQGVTVAASIFTIATLSVDRFLAIRHPMIFRRVSNTRIAIKLIFTIWIVSLLIMVPLLFVRSVETIHWLKEPIYLCNEMWEDTSQRVAYDMCLFVVVYIIPGIIIFTSYILIGSKLWTEDKNLQRTESETSKGIGKHVMTGRKRVAKMLIALAILFALCWMPYYIVNLYLDFSTTHATMLLIILPFTILLGHSNSAFNPILYFYSSKSFRKYLFRALKCSKRRTKRSLAVRYTPAQNHNNNGTTRPRIRISSTGSFKSSGTGSFRFSRSSNNSFKSSFTGRSRENREKHSKRGAEDKPEHSIRMERKGYTLPLLHGSENDGSKLYKSLHKKEILDMSLSIPSTINEESSRLGSTSPMNPMSIFKPEVMPDIEEAPEEIQLYLSVSNTNLSLKYIDDDTEEDL